MRAPSAPRTPGGNTRGRAALTGSQIELLTRAAHKSMADCDIEISPCKVSRLVRRFAKVLSRSRMTFHEFLDDAANQRRLKLTDPDLARVIAYLDPVGERAVGHVIRQRGY